MPARSRSNKRDSNEGAGKHRPTTRAESPERQPHALRSVLDLSLARTNAGLGFHSQSTDNAPFVDDDFGRLVLSARPRSSVLTPNQRTTPPWWMMISVASCYKPQKKAQCPSISWMDGGLMIHQQADRQNSQFWANTIHTRGWMDA